jgi:cbb3-type cytochrome oxidase subunit 3
MKHVAIKINMTFLVCVYFMYGPHARMYESFKIVEW